MEEKVEAAGAVFLPAAGYRVGTTIGQAGEFGYYWSGTRYVVPQEGAYEAYFVEIADGMFTDFCTYYKKYAMYYGSSVRLVKNVN